MGNKDKCSKSFSLFAKLSLSVIAGLFAFTNSFDVNAEAPDSTYEIVVDTSYKSLGEKEDGDPEDKVSDTRFTSAVWHDIEVEFQGGNHFMLAGVWDIPKQTYEAQSGVNPVDEITFSDENTYKLHLDCGITDDDYSADELAKLVVWEYELKTFTNKAGNAVEYYERVPKAESPIVTYANGEVIILKNLNPENPIAIMVDNGKEPAIANETQAAMNDDGYKYDPYWHLYYTDGYIKNHNNFDIEYYNYEKAVDLVEGTPVYFLTLTGYHQGLEDYVTAATAMADGHLASSVTGSGYGKSPMPEDISTDDYMIDDWNIPATWTDPYEGITYTVILGENFDDSYGVATPYYPVFPTLTKNITVDTGVTLPEDARYLFTTLQGYSFNHRWEGSGGHGWVGLSGGPLYQASAEDYPSLTTTITESFKFVGDGTIGSNVQNMSCMFKFRSQNYFLSDFDISKLDTSSATDMSYMLDVNLSSGDSIKGLSSIDTSSAVDLKRMFSVTTDNKDKPLALTGENVAGFDISSAEDITEMFADSDITEIDLSGFDFSKITSLNKMFWRCKVLEKVTFGEDTNTINVTDMSKLFEGCTSLSEFIGLNNLDTVNVTTMAGMFGQYFYRTKVTGSKTKVTFEYPGPCVTTLDLSGFDTSKVTDMSGMFYLPEATTLDISPLETGEVKTMAKMFYLPKVASLNVSTLNTSKVTNMGGMFDLASVPTLNVSMLDTSNVTDMNTMFTLEKAESLTFGLDTSNVVNMSNMFTLNSVEDFDIAMDISSASSLPSFNLASCKTLKVSFSGNGDHVNGAMSFNAPMLDTLDLTGVELNGNMLSRGSLDEYSVGELVDIYLPAVLPDGWSEVPSLPGKFYIVGDIAEDNEKPAEYSDFEALIGDKSDFAILSGDEGEAYVDPYSDRPVKPIEGAILLRAVVEVVPTITPTVTPTAVPTASPTPTSTPEPTAAPTAAPTVAPTATPTEEPKLPAAGTEEKSKDGKATYKVTGTTKDESGKEVAKVTYKKPEGKSLKAKTVTVPDTVTLEDGSKAVVTEIAPKAFYKNTKIKKINIGKNIVQIGSKAFYGCKNVKTIKIKTKTLKKNYFGKDSLKKINKKAVIYVPNTITKKQLNRLKQNLKKAGIPATVKIKKSK